MTGRRTSLASLAGQKVDDVPGKSDPLLLTLPLEKLVPTRFNPRRNFGSEEDLKEFGLKLKRRQLQPAVVVSRSGYLKLWPEEEDNVGETPYVIANGERRYRGSHAAGLTTLNVVHNEDVAKSRADFLDAVLSENNDREDLDPIERALGIETMVTELGGADKVAAHYGKTKGWVSQQRKLLKLTPALQDLVSKGDLPIRVARDIAGLSAAEQAAAWKEELRRRAAAQAGSRPRRAKAQIDNAPAKQSQTKELEAGQKAASSSERFTAVNRSEMPESAENAESQVPAVPPQAAAGTPAVAAVAAEADPSETDTVSQPKRLPYDNPFYIVQHLHMKMASDHFVEGGRAWMAVLRKQHPEEYQALLRDLSEQEQPA
ncbi:ParB/RepB/Spo0J family partition protein [Streptomyces sp. MCA2]|uniref:ParB/RepB/Spo0J family partition protein n=1 Tax=Streptomyces sp. MCA2 TaxID=2944805 RepID=UPI0020228247|nr:ParB/RepB/Spo0J family partition protein [Streptomyces sp. MCA2]MCL7496073.1 ParB/RepB/Spo0J family partition protein [Streptomyces sp. MCA2]